MAKVTLQWSERAVSDLSAIIEYVANDSVPMARTFARKVIAAVETIADYPTIGRIVPEFGDSRYRELIYRNYRIVYELTEKNATIVTIFHGSRLLT